MSNGKTCQACKYMGNGIGDKKACYLKPPNSDFVTDKKCIR